MNEWDIEEAVYTHRRYPIKGKAARILHRLVKLVNSVSDGWAHWQAPKRAAKKLMAIVQDATREPTEAELKAAIAPIKAMLTRETTTFKGQTLDFEDGKTKTRPIEMFVAWGNKTWDTRMVEIPATTLDHDIDAEATLAMRDLLSGQPDVAFVGVYRVPANE